MAGPIFVPSDIQHFSARARKFEHALLAMLRIDRQKPIALLQRKRSIPAMPLHPLSEFARGYPPPSLTLGGGGV